MQLKGLRRSRGRGRQAVEGHEEGGSPPSGDGGHQTGNVLLCLARFPPFGTVRSVVAPALLAGIALASIGCASIGPPRDVQPVVRKMEVTAYCACGECCGWKRTWYGRAVVANGPNRGKPKQVGMTASGDKARRGTIAADTTRYPFGTIMQIDGFGYGRVEDRGGSIKGDHIDLFFPSHREAMLWGRRNLNVRVWFMPSLHGELLDLESVLAATEASIGGNPATVD